MSSNKKTKSQYSFTIICIIGFVVSIFFEFYFISYFPYDYFMLFGTGIILCIFGYLSIDGVLEIIHQTSRKRDEQNEIMIKASKAIYLTTKKIALNSSHSIPDTLETPKDFSSLIDDLSQANERLAKEIENAVSLQSLVQKNRSIVNNAREIIEDREQPLSPLEVEKDLKLDEAISETDFETVTQPETIDSMIRQEVAVQEIAAQKTVLETIDSTAGQKGYEAEMPAAADILEETIDAVGSIMKEEKMAEPISDSSALKASESVFDTSALKASESVSENPALKASEMVSENQSKEAEYSSGTVVDIFSEVKETANSVLNSFADNNTTAEDSIAADNTIKTESNVTTEGSALAENIEIESKHAAANGESAINSTLTENTEIEDKYAAANDESVVRSILTENTETTENSGSAEKNDAIQNNLVAEKNETAAKNETVQNNTAIENSESAVSDMKIETGESADTTVSATSSESTNPVSSISEPKTPFAQNSSSADSSKTAEASAPADKPMTSEEIAALFANL